MYLAFLEFVLPIFSYLNKQMQSEAPQIHTPRKTIFHAPRTILDCYMKSSYLAPTPAEEIEFKNPSVPWSQGSILASQRNKPPSTSRRKLQTDMSRLLHRERTADLLKVCTQGSGYQTSGNA
ncbi:unnamed protein product [Ixodes persulcatus]